MTNFRVEANDIRQQATAVTTRHGTVCVRFAAVERPADYRLLL